MTHDRPRLFTKEFLELLESQPMANEFLELIMSQGKSFYDTVIELAIYYRLTPEFIERKSKNR